MHSHTYVSYLSFIFNYFNLKTNGECLIADLPFKSTTNSFSTLKIKAFFSLYYFWWPTESNFGC